jgi:phytanoyl-CoA hydroxylase
MNRTRSVAQADIESYEENGYIQFKSFFSVEEMALLRSAIDDAIARNRDRIVGAKNGGRSSEDYGRVFNQMVDLWTDCPDIKPFSFNRRLAESARRLSRANSVRIYHDHAMIKPGGQQSKATNWHQDFPYWPMDPAGSLSAWVAVDDVTIKNGCLHFCPGSHRFGKQDAIKLGVEGESIVSKMKERGYRVADPVPMDMPAGGVTFHHGCNFHYAGPNLTDRPRRAFAVIYIPDYVSFTGGKDEAGGADELETGGPWGHPLHPILASKASSD